MKMVILNTTRGRLILISLVTALEWTTEFLLYKQNIMYEVGIIVMLS